MKRLGAAGGFLVALTLLAMLAPWLPLRDPAAQPDTLVLRDLAPFSRAVAVALADGSLRYAHEVRELGDRAIEYRRGSTWTRIATIELAGTSRDDWHRRPVFLLGTDGFGRDLLSRLIHGARISLFVGGLAALMALVIGSAIGLFAGLAGGVTDSVLMRLTDLVLSVPRLFLALMLVALYGASLTTTVWILGGTTWMAAARLVRAEVLSARDRDFVLAARASGLGPLRLALKHLMPAAAVPVLVEGSLRVGEAILMESALSFLGLGVPAPAPSWGNLIADGRGSLFDAWWIATLPGLAIAATVIALNLVGETARERL